MDFHKPTPFEDVVVAVFLSILFIIIQLLQSRYLKKVAQEVNLAKNEGVLAMEFTTITNQHAAIKL